MARRKRKKCYSGIGGQAVLEGVMMKNKDLYAVAVRRSNGEIVVDTQEFAGILHDSILKKLPFVRGVFYFLDSLSLGMKSLNYSASFYEDEEKKETVPDKALNKVTGGRAEGVFIGLTMILSVALSVAVFIVLPYFLSTMFAKYVRNSSLLNIIEGGIRIAIFLLYVILISLMRDIRRVYMYHGAEHKCINCIERGRELDVHNVMRSSRMHRRCGTSFLLFVMLVSIVLFFFINVTNPVYRIVLRIALIPVVAGISYELIRFAGTHDNVIVRILSAPGLLLQRLTTREPDAAMIEVAIKSIEAVFDWKEFLKENFDYDVDAENAREAAARAADEAEEAKEAAARDAKAAARAEEAAAAREAAARAVKEAAARDAEAAARAAKEAARAAKQAAARDAEAAARAAKEAAERAAEEAAK